MANKDLFAFEWRVDQDGYDLEFIQPEPPAKSTPITLLSESRPEPHWAVKPRGGPTRNYRPLEDHPGLARRFADLAQTPRDNAALVDLADTFGLLTTREPEPVYGLLTAREPEPVSDWWDLIHALHTLFSMMDAGDIEGACATFNRHIQSRFTATIHYGRARRPELKMTPFSLAGALWFQVAGELTHGTKFKRCLQCPNWFPVGRGTGHRETRKFCSNRCRMAWHRHNKEKAK